MNKTLLLILLDFLLLHMIHDSPWNKVEKENAHLSGGTDTYAKHAEELQFVRLQMEAEEEENRKLADLLAFSKQGEQEKMNAIAKVMGEKENLRGDLKDAKAAIGEIEKQRLIALKDAAVQADQAQTQKQQKEERDEQISFLTNTVSNLKGEIGDLNNRMGDLKNAFTTRITNLDNNNTDLERKNATLTANVKNLNTNLNNLQGNLNTSRTQIASLDKNLKNTTNRLIATDQQLQAAKTTVTDLTVKNTTLANQRDSALTEKATAVTQVKNLNVKIGEEQERTVAAKSLAQKQRARADSAEKEVVSKTAQAKAVAEERDHVLKQNKVLTDDIKEVAKSADFNTKRTLDQVIENAKAIPQSPNKLFNEYLANRVPVQIQLSRNKPGVVFVNNQPRAAPRQINKISQPILVMGEKYLYALLHTDDSPFALDLLGGAKWEKAAGVFRRNGNNIPVHWLGFLKSDPRVVAVPLHKDSMDKKHLNVQKTYPLSKRPQDYPEAVIIHNGEAYGVVEFKVDPKLGNYVLMEKPTFIGKLFNRKFNPARGDVVLSRTGELLGIMVNSKYCLIIRENELDDLANSYAKFFELNNKAQVNGLGDTLRGLKGIIQKKPRELR